MVTGAEEVLSRRQLRRAVISATVGTTIEWYDIVLYGLLAGVYFGRLFFPTSDPFAAGMAGFGTLLVSFLARPIGAMIFGHYGDRIGRKGTLIATLLLAGICSFLIGVLPTYGQVGVLAPILLVLLRIGVGMALGGEWGGAVLLTLEWGNRYRRGFWTSWPQTGFALGVALSSLALQLSLLLVGQSSPWVWRLPFLASGVIILVGLYVRLGILETPTFVALLERRRIERFPLLTVIRKQWRELVLTALLRGVEQAPAVLFVAFLLTYGTQFLHFGQRQLALAMTISAVLSVGTIVLSGYLADVYGRKRMYLLATVLMFAFALPYFALLQTAVPARVYLAILLSFPILGFVWGPVASFVAENFTGRLRYSGAAVGSGLAAIIAGPVPIIALALLQHYQSSLPIGVMLMVYAAVSFIAASLVRDRSKQDLTAEYDEREGEREVQPTPSRVTTR
jgi:MFS family permease